MEVRIRRHSEFSRQDVNIYSTVPITYAQAALGSEILINTVDGKIVYTVKPGTQTDTRVRLKGKGVPYLRDNNMRGDHSVTLVVQVPTKLNSKAKELLKEFDEQTGDSMNVVTRFENAKAREAGKEEKDSEKKGGKKKKKGLFG